MRRRHLDSIRIPTAGFTLKWVRPAPASFCTPDRRPVLISTGGLRQPGRDGMDQGAGRIVARQVADRGARQIQALRRGAG